VEIVTLRVRRIGRVTPLQLPQVSAARGDGGPTMSNVVGADGLPQPTPVVTRASLLAAGATLGPLLLIDPEATAYAPSGWIARAGEKGEVILERAGSS
jgi:N-methylhydantoinase A/oxoprolinase/acetone carboxylase beta subunit